MKLIRMKQDIQSLNKGEIYKVEKTYGDKEVFEVEGVLIKPTQCEELFYTPKNKGDTIIYYNEYTKRNDTHLYQKEITTITKAKTGGRTASYQESNVKSYYKVIYNGDLTICIIEDKYKGIAKRNPKDEYSRQIGHDLAYYRARIKQYKDKITRIGG